MPQQSAAWDEPVEAICAFLVVQSAWLQRALRAAHDEHVRDVALAVHERGHERWMRILAASPEADGDLASLYVLHGRVAELLIRKVPGGDADAVRRILGERVEERTRAAVKRLRVLHDGHRS